MKLQILPASGIISPAAKKSGYGAKLDESIGVCSLRVLAIMLSIRSSKVPVQAEKNKRILYIRLGCHILQIYDHKKMSPI